MKDNFPMEVFPPGAVLQEELNARGWSQADLAAILGRPPRVVNEIIKAKRAITPETAHGLGEALSTGPELWMNLESLYQLSLVRVKHSVVARRARIFGRFPVRELQKRGWISEGSNLDKLERSLLAFFGMENLESEFTIAHAAKRTTYEKITALQAAWLSRARQLGPQAAVSGKYSHEEMPELYGRLRACMESLEDLRKIPELLSSAGIRLVVLEHLPGSKIDGACLWLSPDEPVVALSLRYDRHDMLCHALFHELDHIEHNEGRTEAILDTDLMSPDVNESPEPIEERATKNAAERLITTKDLDAFIATATNSYSESKIVGFAKMVGVHPGIVVGRLQHAELLPWASYNQLKSKVRNVVTQFVLTDGFGTFIK